MLTAEEIRLLINVLSTKRFEVVIEGDTATVVGVMRRDPGYANDARHAALQAKLSIMLEAESRRGR